MSSKYKTGWFNDSHRHYLAAKYGSSNKSYFASSDGLNFFGRLAKDMGELKTNRLRNLEVIPVQQAQYREQLATQPVITRPLSVQEEDEAKRVAYNRLGLISAIRGQSKDAQLEFARAKRAGTLTGLQERAKLRANERFEQLKTSEQNRAANTAAAAARVDDRVAKLKRGFTEREAERDRLRAVRAAEDAAARSSRNYASVDPSLMDSLLANQASTQATTEARERELLNIIESGKFDPRKYSEVVTLNKRLSVERFAEELLKGKPNTLSFLERDWISTVVGTPGVVPRNTPESVDALIARYPGPAMEREKLNAMVSDRQKQWFDIEANVPIRPDANRPNRPVPPVTNSEVYS